MQLIEVSSFAMRSAVIRLRRSGTPLEFVLFPMIHQATPAFYAEIMARLGRCQLIVAEGVGKTAVVQALEAVHQQRSQEPISVAVVYGAAHMPAVARALAARYGYRPMGAEWVTVFSF